MSLSEDELIARYRAIAAGGCAMIILGDVPVLKHGFGPSLYTKKGFALYQRIAETVHAEGCLLCAQLHQSDSNIKAMLKYIPGVLTKRISMADLRPLLNEQVGPYITQFAGTQDSRNHGCLRGRCRARAQSRLRHGANSRRPHVRQLQLNRIQPPHG